MPRNLYDTYFIDDDGRRIADPGGFVLNAKIRAVNGAFKKELANSAQRAAKAAATVLTEGIETRTNKKRSSGELKASVKFSESKYVPGGGDYSFPQIPAGGGRPIKIPGTSIPLEKEFSGGGYYQASVTVGEGVPHASYWFKGTGKHRKALRGNAIVPDIFEPPGRIYAKKTTLWASENPEKADRAVFKYEAGGVQYYTHSFAGQEDNLDLIRKSRTAANAVLRNKIKNVKTAYEDNKFKQAFPTK